MTAESQNILEDFYSGNSKDIQVTVTEFSGSAKDLTSAIITYAIVDDNEEWVVQKSSLNGASQIEITDAPNGVFVIHILPSDTIHLHGDYIQHANVIDNTEDEETVMVGRIRIYKSFAQRYKYGQITAYLAGG